MGALKPLHWIIVLVIVLLLFGAKRLPDLAKSLGQSMKIFKKEIGDLTADDSPAAQVTPAVEVVKAPAVPAQHVGSEGSTPPQA